MSFRPFSLILKPAVILIVMRKRLMCSSCILWPTLCSAICLCQLPLSPPTQHILLKSTGSVDRDCRALGLLSPHMAWSAPSALLVKPSLTPISCLGCRVTLQMAAGWVAAIETCCHHVTATPEGPQQHLPSQSAMEPSQPNIFMPPDASVTQLGNHPLPLSCLYLLPSSLQRNGKLLGRDYPAIFSPGTEWAPKGVLEN